MKGGLKGRDDRNVDQTASTLDAEIQLQNEAGELRPGMYGRGSIVKYMHSAAVVIPAGALQITDGNRFAYVLKGDKVERRRVQTGVDGGSWLEVERGLARGDEIVTAGIDGLADGMTVRVTRGVSPYTGAPPPSAK